MMSLISYSPPEWCQSVKNVPTHFVELTQSPTPIETWNLPKIPEKFSLFIKRDDMTGSVMAGNKVRKLDFLLGDAIKNNCKHILTFGVIQSNQARALSAACAQLKLECHILLINEKQQRLEDIACEGNFLLDCLFGSNIYLLDAAFLKPPFTMMRSAMDGLAQTIKVETGEDSYNISIANNPIGVWGYIECFREILEQVGSDGVDDIVVSAGSAVTAAGLAIGNYLAGMPFRCHAISVSRDREHTYQYTDKVLGLLGLEDVQSSEIVHAYDEYKGLGYGLSTPHIDEFVAQTAAQTGILLDRIYTGKSAYGLIDLMNNHADVFKGNRILFINTGASHANITSETAELLMEYSECSIKQWPIENGSASTCNTI